MWGFFSSSVPPPALGMLCFPCHHPGELKMSPLPLKTRVSAEPNEAPN